MVINPHVKTGLPWWIKSVDIPARKTKGVSMSRFLKKYAMGTREINKAVKRINKLNRNFRSVISGMFTTEITKVRVITSFTVVFRLWIGELK